MAGLKGMKRQKEKERMGMTLKKMLARSEEDDGQNTAVPHDVDSEGTSGVCRQEMPHLR